MESNTATATFEYVPIREKLSYALTNTGQVMIYTLFTTYFLLFMTDYLHIDPKVAGLVLMVTRILDALNDPIMGQILDKTNTRWGKCKFYMLFTPIPVALCAIAVFSPLRFGDMTIQTVYITALYIVFTLLYTANDIPYWSMSAVITTDPKQRTTIVTMTRLIGGAGSALAIGLFWTINGLFNDGAGVNGDMSFFLTCAIFCVLGAVLMLQGYFNTKERARITSEENRSAENLKLIPKCKPLLLNLIAGALMSVTTIGSTALSTYFIKWNIKSIFAEMSSNTVMSVFTPVINVLPAAAAVIGLLIAPKLIKKFEKRNILLAASALGVISNVAFYFVGYQSTVQLIFFLIGRFFAFLPLGIWSSVTTIMIGDCVDYIEYKTGKRVEGTCFSMLTFMSQFQNSINVAITGLMLGIAGYNGALDANIAQQSEKTLHMIYIMTTLIPAAGYIIMSIPFFFYNFNNKQHKMMLEVIAARNAGLDTTPPPGMFWRRKLAPAAAGSAPYIPPYTSSKIMEMVVLCCPNCGEELAATSGELVRCPHCGNITIV